MDPENQKLVSILDAVVSDVFQMDRSYLVAKQIGENCDALNQALDGSFSELVGTVQQVMLTNATLAIARVFDRPGRNKTRCLRRLLTVYDAESQHLEVVQETGLVANVLTRRATPDTVIAALNQSHGQFAQRFTQWMIAEFEAASVSEPLDRLKSLRDKRIAHNEVISLSGPSWDAMKELGELAKYCVAVVGLAAFNRVYMHQDRYFLAEDAARPARAVERLAQLTSRKVQS